MYSNEAPGDAWLSEVFCQRSGALAANDLSSQVE